MTRHLRTALVAGIAVGAAWMAVAVARAVAVDAALGDVDEVTRLRLAPLPTVVDLDGAREQVERLGEAAVEVRPRATAARCRFPAV